MAFISTYWPILVLAYVGVLGLIWRAFYVCAQGDDDRRNDIANRGGVQAPNVFPLVHNGDNARG